jgi:hypothetical protein
MRRWLICLILLSCLGLVRANVLEAVDDQSDNLLVKFVSDILHCEKRKDPFRVHDVAFMQLEEFHRVELYEKLLARVSEDFSVIQPSIEESVVNERLHVVSFFIVLTRQNDFVGI